MAEVPCYEEKMMKKVALVTGGGSGMGEFTCKRFSQEGIAVGVLDLDFASAQRVTNEILEQGGQALALHADVSNRAQIANVAVQLRNAFGPINVVVNNAACEGFSMFQDIEDEAWDRMMDVNLKGAFIVSQECLPDMESCEWGRIINISAYGVQMSTPGMGHYFASKGGLIAMTRCLAAEVGHKGITVNSISPGFIDTPMARRAIDGGAFPNGAQAIYGAYPIPRLGKPQEIAGTCAFLVSEDAAYITAQTINVSGGAVV